jgi:hypothetical protein
MTLNQYEKAHIALLAQIAKATERIADAIETFNATDPLQAIERALDADDFAKHYTPAVSGDGFDPRADAKYGADVPEGERWRLGE